MPEWTKAQNNAINADGSNILVSAAAGSGKTAVLVERVKRLITDESLGVNIDDLLVVTFTNAAAAEMKSRISRSLDELISKEPNNTNLLRQMSLLPNAKICTIDSFCINLVREYFFKLDIAQDFRILEDTQKALIEESVIEEIINGMYESKNEDFKALVEMFSTTKSDSDLIKSVKRLDNFITAQPFPFEWLNEVSELYNPEIGIDSSMLKEYAVSELSYILDYFRDSIGYAQSVLYPEDELFEKYGAALENDRAELIRLENVLDKSWDEIRDVLLNLKFSSTPYKRNYESDVKNIVAETRKLYCGKNSIINSELIPLFSASSGEIQEDNEVLYPVLKQLISLVREYHEKCFEAKKELNAYTFSDIEHFAIELLFKRNEDGSIIRTDIAEEYRNNFYEILVDEYQDTNTAQDTLFEMLSNGHNLFMVGDVKQSIYRFRLAMPQIFNAKKDSFSHYDKESASVNQKIILDRNFRSAKEICDYSNYLFSMLMTKRVGELDYNEEEYLYANKTPENNGVPHVELNLVQVPDGENADEYEALQIAKKIYDKVSSRELIRDGETEREIRYGDFAILLRSTKNRIDIYSKALSSFGIPVKADNRTNLFDNNEVSILLSLLRVVDNPTLDIPLVATLMSVFYGYTADEIARARVNYKANNIYSSISRDTETFSAFLSDLERYRGYAASMSVESFIRQVISDSSFLSVISAMGNYEQRQLNVMKLISLAKSFDSGESVGLTAFIRYIDRVIENNVSLESAEVAGFNDDCVQIMSIHKSKGLEFPVCILAGTAHRYNNDDLKSLILLNDSYGVGLKLINEEHLYRYNSLQYTAIKNMLSVASMSENLRVLYVAITRAENQFMAFASYPDVAKRVNSLSAKITGGSINPYVVKKATCDADLLILPALLHPCGKPLRELCENDVKFLPDEKSVFSVGILSDNVSAGEETVTTVPYSEKLVKEIEEKLSFKYEGAELSGYSAKRNASSLDENEQGFKFFAKKVPSFISGDTLTGAELGTAMHSFMQYFSYENAAADLENEIQRLEACGRLTELQAKALNRDKLNAFLNNDISARMFNSDKLYREYKISSFVPLCELENTESREPVFVQGIADAVFEESDGLVLVDYKTDVTDTEEELLAMYKNQIAFYKSAVEKSLGKPVKEAMLYSFNLKKCCVYK